MERTIDTHLPSTPVRSRLILHVSALHKDYKLLLPTWDNEKLLVWAHPDDRPVYAQKLKEEDRLLNPTYYE